MCSISTKFICLMKHFKSFSGRRSHQFFFQPIPPSYDLPGTDFRGYSPSDAISSEGSSPGAISQSQRSPPSSSLNLKVCLFIFA